MSQPLFRMPACVEVFEHNGKQVFINPQVPAWIVTNDLGAMIMSLFDGVYSIDEIAETVVQALGNDKRQQVNDFCHHVLSSGVLGNIDPQEHERDTSLHSVHLSLSSSCNLQCKYCYAAERIESKHPHLTLDEYKQVIDDLCNISSGITFTITGGEPLLNPLWQTIAQYIKSKGCTLLLLSNGLLINEKNIDFIKQHFDLVTLSLDGPTRESHKLTRGDNFEAVLKAVNLLKEHNVDHTISMTVTRLNIDQVEAMARRFGSRLNFAPLFPVSDLANDQLSITGEQYYQALSQAFGVEPLSYCEASLDMSKHMKSRKCAIGDNEISISPTGDVYPCQLLHMSQFLAGNIHEQSIIDIYRNSEALKRCANLDVDSIEKCRDCAIRYICGGACRARGFYETGDIASTGDFCHYEKEAFLDGITKIYSSNAL